MDVLRHSLIRQGLGLPSAVRAGRSAGLWLRRNLYLLLLLAPLVLYLPAIVFWSSPDRFAVVRSGSMEPKFSAGDLVFLRPVRQVEVGDVIAFRTPRGIDGSVSRLLHRVVAVDDTRDRFTTKGDANQEPDPFKVGLESLVGEATGFKVPYAGYVTLFLQSRLGLTWLAIIALVSLYPTLTRLAAWARRTAHRALTQAVGLETEQLDRVAAGVNENREVLQELSSSIVGGLEAGQLHRMAAGVNVNRETLQELSSSINKYVKGLHIHSETPDEFSEISKSLARSSGGQTREIEDFIEPGEREAPLRGEGRSA